MTWLSALKETARTGLTVERKRLEPLVAARGAAGLALVIGLSLTLFGPAVAASSAFGAFQAAIATFQRSWRPRPELALASGTSLAVSTFLGYLTGSHLLLFLALLCLWTFLAGLSWAAGPTVGIIASSNVAIMLVTVTLPTSVAEAAGHAAMMIVGGCVQAALVVLFPVRRWGAHRDALADALAAEADYARRLRHDPVAPFDPEPLMAARDAARITPRQARTRPAELRGSRGVAERIRPVLASLADPAVGVPEEGRERDRVREILAAAGTVLDAAARAIRHGEPVRVAPAALAALRTPDTGAILKGPAHRAAARLSALLKDVLETAGGTQPPPTPAKAPPGSGAPRGVTPGSGAPRGEGTPPGSEVPRDESASGSGAPRGEAPPGFGVSRGEGASGSGVSRGEGASGFGVSRGEGAPGSGVPCGEAPPASEASRGEGTPPGSEVPRDESASGSGAPRGEAPPASEAASEARPASEASPEGRPAAEASPEARPAADAPPARPAAEASPEARPAAEVSAEARPAAEGPADAQPVADAPPEARPAADAPPEARPAADAPPEARPAAETPPEARPAGVPVPLLRPTFPALVPSGLRAMRAALRHESPIARHAIRVTAVAAAGYLLGTWLPFGHGYWAPMAAVMVLRPDFSQTYSRAVARFGGTLVGVALATGLVQLAHPGTALSAAVAVVCAGLMYLLMRTGQVAAQACVSAYVVFLLGMGGQQWTQTVPERVILTLLGGVLAMIAYAVYPAWETPRLRTRLADWLVADGRYAAAVVDHYADPAGSASPDVREALLAARDARVAWHEASDRAKNEPVRHRGLSRATAADAEECLGQLGRVAMLMEAHLPDRDATPVPAAARLADALRKATEQGAKAVRERRVPEWDAVRTALAEWDGEGVPDRVVRRGAGLLLDALDDLSDALDTAPPPMLVDGTSARTEADGASARTDAPGRPEDRKGPPADGPAGP